MSDGRVRWGVIAAFAGLALTPLRASALQKFGPLQLSGNLQTQNLIRHPDASTFEYIQNRNVMRVRLDYDWLTAGKFYNRIDVPFIESSHFFLLWRGVYDSVYDTTPGFLAKTDIHGRAYGGLNVFDYAHKNGNPAFGGKPFTIHQLGLSGLTPDQRDALKFDNQLREMYADVKFRGIPLTIRAGRQQIVWGETDNFRMLDRANSLDLTWHFQQEIPAPPFGWDEIRRPFWMIKFLYDVGDVWKFSQNFLEWYWNPGDWYPAKQTFAPRPWGLPFANPLTNPIDGAFISGTCATSQVKKVGPNGEGECVRLLNDTELFKHGDYSRNPLENSQVGVRYHSIAPFGLEFTLNYFYQRFAGDDGTNYAPLKGLPKPVTNAEKAHISSLLRDGTFPAEANMPYVHTLGLSANYSDETITQAVFRMETIYDVGIPFFDVAKETAVARPALPGVTKKNMWKGMIAFDRPTWIRTVNKKSTVFLTGQFFWHYLADNPSCDIPDSVKPFPGAHGAGDVGTFLDSAGKKAVGSCLVGGLDLPSGARAGTGDPKSPAYRDKIRDWETLATFAMFTFYRGGSVVPIMGLAIDTTNQFNMEPFWTVDYFVTGDIAVNIAQRYFVTPRGRSEPIFETWGLAGLNAGRSETSIRLTYQF